MSGSETYAMLRSFADSWGMAAMVVSFLVFAVWPFLPGGKKSAQEAANMIFEDDDNGQ